MSHTLTFDLPDTSALDDVNVDDDALTGAYSRAVALMASRAYQEEKRSRATRARVAARRTTTDYVPIPDAIQAHLSAYPAF